MSSALSALTQDIQNSPVEPQNLVSDELIIPATEQNAHVIAESLEKVNPAPTPNHLTEAEQKQVEVYKRSIDFTKADALFAYGSDTKSAIRNISKQALENVRTKDSGIPGEQISSLITQMKGFGQPSGNMIERLKQRSLGILERYKVQYSSLEASIDNFEQLVLKDLAKSVGHISTAGTLKDAALERRYTANLQIIAGEQAIAEFRANYPAREAQARLEHDSATALQRLADEASLVDDFELHLGELRTISSMCLQSAARNMLQQRNARNQARTSSTIINITIPAFRDMAMVCILSEEQKRIADNHEMISRATNELAEQTALLTDQVAIQVENIASSPMLKVETIQKTGDSFVATLERIKTIRDDAFRAQAENQMLLADVDRKILQASIESRRV